MQEFVRKQNIARVKRQLEEERDPAKRRVLEDVLADLERGGDGIRHQDYTRDGEP